MRGTTATTADDVGRIRVLTIAITPPQQGQSIGGRFLRGGEKRLGSNCVFHGKLDTNSTANWTVIPRQTGHRFQGKLDSHLS